MGQVLLAEYQCLSVYACQKPLFVHFRLNELWAARDTLLKGTFETVWILSITKILSWNYIKINHASLDAHCAISLLQFKCLVYICNLAMFKTLVELMFPSFTFWNHISKLTRQASVLNTVQMNNVGRSFWHRLVWVCFIILLKQGFQIDHLRPFTSEMIWFKKAAINHEPSLCPQLNVKLPEGKWQ